MSQLVDVAIIGAGPAGVVAALRLQQLGYRVLLIERSQFPRAQIGEAFTPGIKNIIDLLDANEVLAKIPQLKNLPTQVRWQQSTPEWVPANNNIMIDRSAFDHAMLELAKQRGILVRQPAHVDHIGGDAGDWRIRFTDGQGEQTMLANFLLDAQGRHGSATTRIACAPALLATWIDIAPADLPVGVAQATLVEACEFGWLWGSILPNQHFRLMLCCDPHHVEHKAQALLRSQCRASQLFASLADCVTTGRLHASSATPYLDSASYQSNRFKLGDAAFTLDPISSSGVEKAMRFSINAAVALHTLLSDPYKSSGAMVQEFYEQRLIETCARHTLWTRRHYKPAWCADQPFWQNQARAFDFGTAPLGLALQQELSRLENFRPRPPSTRSMLSPQHRIRFNPELKVVQSLCVIDNKVHRHAAFMHPDMDRPLAFLDGEEVVKKLAFMDMQPTLASALDLLGLDMSAQKAQRLLGWFWQHGFLQTMG